MAIPYEDVDRTIAQLEHAIDYADGLLKEDVSNAITQSEKLTNVTEAQLEHASEVTENIEKTDNSIIIGNHADAYTNTPTGQYGIAIGALANASKVESSDVSDGSNIAIGVNSRANVRGIALGGTAKANSGIAIGNEAKTDDDGIAIGTGAEATESGSVALGKLAEVTAEYSAQIGPATNDEYNTLKWAKVPAIGETGNIENITIINSRGKIPASVIEGGGGGGTSDYSQLTNKPSINSVELNGNKSLADLGIQPSGDYATTTALDNGLATKQNLLTAGQNVSINNNVITAGIEVIKI